MKKTVNQLHSEMGSILEMASNNLLIKDIPSLDEFGILKTPNVVYYPPSECKKCELYLQNNLY